MTLQLDRSLGLRTEKERVYNDVRYSTFKYTLKCNQCSWNISFYEASGSIHLDSHKMLCSFCKNNRFICQKSLLQYS